MLFDRPLTDAIIHYLTDNNSITILELYNHIQKIETISRPNFYKIIAQLVSRQVIAKEGKKLLLSSMWIVEYLDLAKKMETLLYNSPVLYQLDAGQCQQFSANSLRDIDSMYGDMYLRIINRTKTKYVYHYQSHFYHVHAFPETEKQFWGGMEKLGVEQFFICGGETFLDRQAADFVRHYGNAQVIHQSIDQLPSQGYMVVVIADWIVECVLPTQLASGFGFFFDTVTSYDQFNADLFRSLFYQKNKITVTVDHNPARAASLISLLKRTERKKQ